MSTFIFNHKFERQEEKGQRLETAKIHFQKEVTKTQKKKRRNFSKGVRSSFGTNIHHLLSIGLKMSVEGGGSKVKESSI
jgi:hypothetical protein